MAVIDRGGNVPNICSHLGSHLLVFQTVPDDIVPQTCRHCHRNTHMRTASLWIIKTLVRHILIYSDSLRKSTACSAFLLTVTTARCFLRLTEGKLGLVSPVPLTPVVVETLAFEVMTGALIYNGGYSTLRAKSSWLLTTTLL